MGIISPTLSSYPTLKKLSPTHTFLKIFTYPRVIYVFPKYEHYLDQYLEFPK